MSNLVVGIGDCQVSNDPAISIITYALGSCIAIAIYDPVSRVGGLLHYLLPESKLDPVKAAINPFMFADTGIPELFHRAYALGAVKTRLCVIAAGGAQVSESETFQIGKRNHLAMKKILWRAGVLLHHEEVGGSQSRTVRLELQSGRFLMKQAAGPEQQIGSTPTNRKDSNRA
jgi:chemotaxis protein CheD